MGTVPIADIMMKLPAPKTIGGTKRLQSCFKFDVDLSAYNVRLSHLDKCVRMSHSSQVMSHSTQRGRWNGTDFGCYKIFFTATPEVAGTSASENMCGIPRPVL